MELSDGGDVPPPSPQAMQARMHTASAPTGCWQCLAPEVLCVLTPRKSTCRSVPDFPIRGEAATLTSAIGVDEEAEASAAKVVVPSKQMDMCFRELTDVRAAGQKQRRLRPGRGVGRGAPTPPRQLGGSAWPQQPRGRLRSVMWVCHVPPSPPSAGARHAQGDAAGTLRRPRAAPRRAGARGGGERGAGRRRGGGGGEAREPTAQPRRRARGGPGGGAGRGANAAGLPVRVLPRSPRAAARSPADLRWISRGAGSRSLWCASTTISSPRSRPCPACSAL